MKAVNKSKDKNPNKYEVKRDAKGKWLPGSVPNPNGRPKRKTLTEMIHAKLDDDDSWKEVVGVVLEKVLKDKDKEIIKAFWDHTDGKAPQSVKLGGDEDNPLKLDVDINDMIGKAYGKIKQGDGTKGN